MMNPFASRTAQMLSIACFVAVPGLGWLLSHQYGQPLAILILGGVMMVWVAVGLCWGMRGFMSGILSIVAMQCIVIGDAWGYAIAGAFIALACHMLADDFASRTSEDDRPEPR